MTPIKKALITGVSGQDGSYLAEFLVEKGYEVHGIVRRTSSIPRPRLESLFRNKDIYNEQFFLHYSDIGNESALRRLIYAISPDEIYHLASQSHVGLSFELPEITLLHNGNATLSLLEILRDCDYPIKLFNASSSEVFGRPSTWPQNEQTPYRPVNPYGATKALSSNLVSIYRTTYDMFLVNGIMYSHESPRRGESFFTRKVCKIAAQIAKGGKDQLVLGNLESHRDWGHASDYVRGMWLALQHETPTDFVFASGVSRPLTSFLDLAFAYVGLEWTDFYRYDHSFSRPIEPFQLVGDSSKAESLLSWERAYSFEDIVKEMMEFELSGN